MSIKLLLFLSVLIIVVGVYIWMAIFSVNPPGNLVAFQRGITMFLKTFGLIAIVMACLVILQLLFCNSHPKDYLVPATLFTLGFALYAQDGISVIAFVFMTGLNVHFSNSNSPDSTAP